MQEHEKFMLRCLELAQNGRGMVAPNPMVGCVVVKDGRIIGEGWHIKYGEAHAEVNAINSIKSPAEVEGATVYVSLEPCAHFGKTPPCADLLVKSKVAEVVIGCKDTFSEVSGKGIEKLQSAGINVTVGVLEKECRELNERFFAFHEKQRPYIILKWAQTADGFIDKIREGKATQGIQNPISGKLSKILVHKWRSEEAAIMAGTNTAINDNPRLNVREWHGKQPLRITIDKEGKLPENLHLLDKTQPTLVFSEKETEPQENLEWIKIDFNNLPEEVCRVLYKKNIQSVIIEGGRHLLDSFIKKGLWDEARVFVAPTYWKKGLEAPNLLNANLKARGTIEKDTLFIYKNAQV
jgi:diaminohydroxyphosphoribosylaminopyrimidine deaminase / 5-amino-6-(5-phosphoribosylamino)uracil reductase